MKRFISFILLAILLFLMPINTFATSYISKLPYEIESFVSSSFSKYVIKETKPLFDCNDNVNAHIILFEPMGYVIYTDCDIIECSHVSNYSLSSGKNYYFGPLQMYAKTSDNNYVNLISSEVYSKSYISDLSSFFAEKQLLVSMNQNNDGLVQPRAVSSHYLPYSTRNYTYNPSGDGRCGSLALAIMLMYYDDHIDSNVVPSWIANADTNGKYFSDLLKPHIEDINPSYGSSTSDLVSGAKWYFSYRGISNQYSVTTIFNSTFSSYKSRIDADRPVIVDLDNHPNYGNHWVVGTGYYKQLLGSSIRELIVVTDGWGSTGIEINYSYVGDLVYFNK